MFSRIFKICLLGVLMGILYPVINLRSPGPAIFIGATGGLLISLMYSLCEFFLFRGKFTQLAFWKQWLYRSIAYSFIIAGGLSILYFVQGFYNYSNNDIAAEEYFFASRLLLVYIFVYAVVIAGVTQLVYLLLRIVGYKNAIRLFSGNFLLPKTEKMLVAAFHISHAEKMLLLLDFLEENNSEVLEVKNDTVLAIWPQSTLKQQPRIFAENIYIGLKNHIQANKSHIKGVSKMLQLHMGCAFDDVIFTQQGISPVKIVKSGPAVTKANSALEYCFKNRLDFYFETEAVETLPAQATSY